MKKVFFAFLFAASVGSVHAQVQFGPKAGLNLANIVGSDADGSKMQAGFYAGGFARLSLTDNIKVQPELLFSAQGAKYENNIEGTIINSNLHFNYINVPIMVQYHTQMGLFLETGPQIGFLMSAKTKTEGVTSDIKDTLKSTDFAWGVGAGYQLGNGLGINARYNVGLSKLDDADNSNVKNGVIQVGLFYVLGGSK